MYNINIFKFKIIDDYDYIINFEKYLTLTNKYNLISLSLNIFSYRLVFRILVN
jgi:hypothetical protein